MDSQDSILLVEDDPGDLELTLAALGELELAGQVVVARDGAEALDFLWRRGRYGSRAGRDPLVVLVDLKLPKVNGLEVTSRIKSDEHLRSIPVVVLTSADEPRRVDACYEAGANALVVKPIAFPEFLDAVKQVGAFWTLLNTAASRAADADGGAPPPTIH